jgi:hypothetical protein
MRSGDEDRESWGAVVFGLTFSIARAAKIIADLPITQGADAVGQIPPPVDRNVLEARHPGMDGHWNRILGWGKLPPCATHRVVREGLNRRLALHRRKPAVG